MPPGPFEISDLNLDIICGRSGSYHQKSPITQKPSIPYLWPPSPSCKRERVIQNILLRLANIEAIAINPEKSLYISGELIWGLPWDITAYGGAQFSEDYRALALGLGLNLGVFGATSFDVTQANSSLVDGSKTSRAILSFSFIPNR